MAEKDSKNSADSYAERGYDELKKGNHEKALPLIRKAYELYRAKNDMKNESRQLELIAYACHAMEDTDGGIEACTLLVPLYQKLGEKKLEAMVSNNLGLLLVRKKEYEKAVDYFSSAQALFEQAGDDEGAAEQLMNIGSVYRDSDETGKALEVYHRALEIFEAGTNEERMADQYTNIAYIHVMKNEIEEALDWYKKALPVYTKTGSTKKAEFTKKNIENLDPDKA